MSGKGYSIGYDRRGAVIITPRRPGTGKGFTLAVAFRRAKVAAGWEVLATGPNGKVRIGVPVDRNMRSQHGAYEPDPMKRGTGR